MARINAHGVAHAMKKTEIKLTEKQSDHVAALRRVRNDIDDGVIINKRNLEEILIEAVDLLDELLEGTPDTVDWYFLRDGGAPGGPAWWIYSPSTDSWHCFYGDDDGGDDETILEDAVETIERVTSGRWRLPSMFQGLDDGAAKIIERFGVSA